MLEEEKSMENDYSHKGCTANVVLILPGDKNSFNNKPGLSGFKPQQESTVFCANAGDSRSILGIQGRAMALSMDHKPTNPGERLRITKAGSYVN